MAAAAHTHRQETNKSILVLRNLHLMVVREVVGLMVLPVVVVTATAMATARGQHGCMGNVGDYKYDLTQLAQRIGGVDPHEQTNNTYYYRVCKQ